MSKDSCQYLFLRETSEAGESVGQGCSLFTCLNIAEQRMLLKSTEHFFSVLKCQAVANGIFCFLNPFLEPASIPCKFFPWSFAILIITYIILSNFFKKGYLERQTKHYSRILEHWHTQKKSLSPLHMQVMITNNAADSLFKSNSCFMVLKNEPELGTLDFLLLIPTIL